MTLFNTLRHDYIYDYEYIMHWLLRITKGRISDFSESKRKLFFHLVIINFFLLYFNCFYELELFFFHIFLSTTSDRENVSLFILKSQKLFYSSCRMLVFCASQLELCTVKRKWLDTSILAREHQIVQKASKWLCEDR